MEKAPLLLLSLPISHARRHTKLLLSLVASLTLLVLILDQRTLPGRGSLLPPFFSYAATTNNDPGAPPSTATSEPQPLTELGFEADLTYENVGSTDKDAYRIELEQFLHRSFPPSDTDASNPDSLLSILHEFLPPPPPAPASHHPQRAYQRLVLLPFQFVVQKVGQLIEQASRIPPPPPPVLRPARHIPQKIFQTSWQPGTEPPSDKSPPRSWKELNQDYQYRYFDNAAAQTFMTERFGSNASAAGTKVLPKGWKEAQSENQGPRKGYTVADTYDKMSSVRVMQSDFWRYSVLAAEGGVYSDLDTRCMKPIDGWHRFPWQRSLTVFQNEPRARPSLIVGVEVDVGDRGDWKKWWPRPLGIAQWTIAGTAGHPVLIDAMRRVSEAVNPFPQPGVHEAQEGIAEQSHRNLDAVVEKTGPGPFTDAVLRYLGAKYNVTWPALQHLPDEGLLFTDADGHADVLVLSVTAFSPGVGQFGAGDIYHAAALVQHLFSGSWKAQHG